jgi:hypothetical protein
VAIGRRVGGLWAARGEGSRGDLLCHSLCRSDNCCRSSTR